MKVSETDVDISSHLLLQHVALGELLFRKKVEHTRGQGRDVEVYPLRSSPLACIIGDLFHNVHT